MRTLAKRLVAPEAIAAGLICPDHWSGPDWVYTDGPAVAEINAKANFEPDPQQQLALDLIFAVNAHFLPAAFSFCVICARQNLKTGTLKQAAVGWLAVTQEQKIVWSSHELTTTVDSQRELHDLFESSPALSRLLPAQKNRGKYDDNLNKRIELTNGQQVLFKARTVSGGRGLAGDKTILDEALFLKPGHTASLLPIMMARPTGQVLYASSPGLLDSVVLRDVRDRGRAGSSPRMFYLEWGGHWRECADPKCAHPKDAEARGLDCAADDRELWVKNNPTVSTGRITLERIADMRQELQPEDFVRECMGLWDDPTGEDEEPAAINARRWGKLVNPKAKKPDGEVVLAVDVNPTRSRAAIGLASEGKKGRTLVMVRTGDGTGWIVPELKRLIRKNDDVTELVLTPGQAAALMPELLKADLGVEIKLLTSSETGQACAAFQEAVKRKLLEHTGQKELDDAVTGARVRTVNEVQLFDRKNFDDEISPLCAVSAASWRYSVVVADGAFNIW